MNAPDLSPAGREIARGLSDALAPVLEARASSLSLHAARDVAQLLSLAGLDRLLAALEPHANLPWPKELGAVIDRLRRTTASCAAQSDLEVFRGADAQLAALAEEVGALEWSPTDGRGAGAFPTVRIAEALADLSFTARDGEAVAAARLTAPAAAALRAAFDWVSGEGGPRRPLDLVLDDDVIEAACTVSDPGGLAAAHAVLGPVGGHLGPRLSDGPASGRWVVRVPIVTAKARYLMIEQGGLKLALPWSAVLRVLMISGDDVERSARAHDAPLLLPLAPLSGGAAERPVVMIASGLLRGLMVADRLIWRLTAEAHEPGQPGPANLESAVRTEDGEIYWVVDPARLLAPLPLPPIIDAISARFEPQAARPARPTAQPPRPSSEPPRLRVLDDREVTPLPAPTPGSAPTTQHPARRSARQVARASASAIETQAPGMTPARPAALIVEDSITARVFLTRMLESRGFEVRAVARAEEAFRELSRGAWSLICADVELPDARGADWLRALIERVSGDAPVVALVRDRHDREIAGAAGLARTLRKPFDEAEISALIARIPGQPRSGA